MLKNKFFAVVLLILFAVALKAQNTDEVIKVDTALVNIPVIVSDRNGRYISGLQTKNFSVFEDGKEQKIEYFASEESPLNVAILIDTSRSTQFVLDDIKRAASDFLAQLKPQDRAMIVSFDNDVEFLSELTANRRVLDDAIYNAEIGYQAGTVLHDAVFEVVDKKFAEVKGRKAIILLTDGKDVGSYVNRNELTYRLEESDTLIYSIFYETGNFGRFNQNRRNLPFPDSRNPRRRDFPFPDDFPRRTNPRRILQEQRNGAAIDFLQQISESTAGRLFQNDLQDLDITFQSIADELRKQYLIGYYPENSTPDQVHQIKVRVDRTDVVVRAKNSYRSK
jgi:VWFA-related protein